MASKPVTITHDQLSGALMADRARVQSILESPAGIANAPLARKLAFNGMDTALALDILQSAPAASDQGNPYVAAMALHGPVGIPPAGTHQPGGNNPATFTAPDEKAARIAEIEESGKAFRGGRPKVPR